MSGLVIWSTIICVRARGYHLALGLAGGREDGDWYFASCFCPRWGAGAVTKPQKLKGNETRILGSTFILSVLGSHWSSYSLLIGGAAISLGF